MSCQLDLQGCRDGSCQAEHLKRLPLGDILHRKSKYRLERQQNKHDVSHATQITSKLPWMPHLGSWA